MTVRKERVDFQFGRPLTIFSPEIDTSQLAELEPRQIYNPVMNFNLDLPGSSYNGNSFS